MYISIAQMQRFASVKRQTQIKMDHRTTSVCAYRPSSCSYSNLQQLSTGLISILELAHEIWVLIA